VLRRSLDAGESTTAVRIGTALLNFWRQFGYRNEGRRWLEDALGPGSDVLPTLRAKAVQTTGELVFSNGDYRGARVWFERAVDDWRALGEGGRSSLPRERRRSRRVRRTQHAGHRRRSRTRRRAVDDARVPRSASPQRGDHSASQATPSVRAAASTLEADRFA